jgi:hypothetical protein
MNKRRLAELVPRAPGENDDVLAARAVNAQPWEPPPGMLKRQCPWCRYLGSPADLFKTAR